MDLGIMAGRVTARMRTAFSINVASTSLADARAYTEVMFEENGMDLDALIPNFDANYSLLKGKMGKAINIPRIQMPVIEPKDMRLFLKRLSTGSIDIFQPWAKGKLDVPKNMSKSDGEEWVELGFEDGDPKDDRIPAKLTNVSAGRLIPTQSQIWLDNIVSNYVQFGVAAAGAKILKQTVIVSREGYILDGHHRFGQAVIADPGLGIRALLVPLSIKLLVKVGKAYGDAIGNKPKASLINA